ncbi:signal peptide peptidase SppA [Xylanibacter ruminicola]|uniref:Protease-4 n=1 Tax=Xylanibacter ruminicola TaxID=839 RepID=A0A1M6TWT1_XYLRU|nr:signal peptide peptidase SppA [Xylanibacter ruminicola]SHK61268.1 protease-4 [Xylanibacter ruminicola]
MKQFLKMTLATICGIVVLGLVMTLFFTISLVGMLASDSASTKVKENSVFVIKLNGSINERAEAGTPFDDLLGLGGEGSMGLDDLVTSIRKAKDEENIKGIYIEGGEASFDSPATTQQLRDALKDFKKSGKWIVSYADDYYQSSYYVATVADKIYLNGEGSIDLRGLGGKGEYYKGLYDKLGIKYMVAKVGKYKSYVESNTQTGMSEYDREQREVLYKGIWNHMLKEMAEGRKIKAANLDQLVNDSLLAFAATEDYVKAKLVDKIMFPEEIKDEIKQRLKLDKDDDIEQLTLADMLNVKSKKKEKGDKIAIYYAYGSIVDNEAMNMLDGGGHCIVGKTTAEDLRKLAEDDDVKAVVFRVNSGGGSAVASEYIRHAIKLVKAKKPVVVSMGGAAASGGYWISSPANYIIAEPTTITGSIGIFGLIPNFSGLVTDKLGVTFDGVKTNKFADYDTELVVGKNNEEIMAKLQNNINRGYQNFLNVVAEGRGMKPEQVNEIAQGRVWLATDAIKIKLVDKLGSLDDAVKKAAELAKLDEYHTAAYPGEVSWLDNLLSKDNKGSYLDAELRELLGDAYLPLMQIRNDIKNNSRIQARMLEDIRMK